MMAGLARAVLTHRKLIFSLWIALTLLGAFAANQVSKRWLEQFSIPGYSAYETNQRTLKIFGSGEQTRTLTHIDDIADGIFTALSHEAALQEDFNISANEELTVKEIAAITWEACGNDAADFELEHLPSFEVDVQRRWPSTEKARRLLGWQAQIGAREGIAQTVEWFRNRS